MFGSNQYIDSSFLIEYLNILKFMYQKNIGKCKTFIFHTANKKTTKIIIAHPTIYNNLWKQKCQNNGSLENITKTHDIYYLYTTKPMF